jgi:hypothetical protein
VSNWNIWGRVDALVHEVGTRLISIIALFCSAVGEMNSTGLTTKPPLNHFTNQTRDQLRFLLSHKDERKNPRVCNTCSQLMSLENVFSLKVRLPERKKESDMYQGVRLSGRD